MKHLREFEEWNPDEFNQDDMDQDLTRLGFLPEAKYKISLIFPADYETEIFVGDESVDGTYNGMMLKLLLESGSVTKEQDTEILNMISRLLEAAGEDPVMSAEEIQKITDGESVWADEIMADNSESAGYEMLLSFYAMLDKMLKANPPAMSITESELDYPYFIYLEDPYSTSYMDSILPSEGVGDARSAFVDKIGSPGNTDLNKIVTSLGKGEFVRLLAYENTNSEKMLNYRRNTYDDNVKIFIERMSTKNNDVLCSFGFGFSLLT